MSTTSNKIMDAAKMEAVVKRLAFQIYESNVSNKKVVIAGIAKNGLLLAEELCTHLVAISNLEVSCVAIIMDKKNPMHSLTTDTPLEQLKNESVVIVDDVLNTGKTLIHAVHHFLSVPLTQLQTAVMVNRNHKKYPIKADFKGLSLSTSLKEHVEVEMKGAKKGVYLT